MASLIGLPPQVACDIEGALSGLKSCYGDDVLGLLSDRSAVGGISTGSIGLDAATGVGGFPRGRLTEVFGPPSTGKTTLALQGVAQTQRNGGNAAYVDADRALDVGYAKNIGVDPGKLILCHPKYGEQAFDIAVMLIQSGALEMLVVDSVAALLPQEDMELGFSGGCNTSQAAMLSRGCAKLVDAAYANNCAVVLINQLRINTRAVNEDQRETTAGGLALKSYASLRLDVRCRGLLKTGSQTVGQRTCVTVKNNKLGIPYGFAVYDTLFGSGILFESEFLDIGSSLGMIKTDGQEYRLNGCILGSSKREACSQLKSNKSMSDKLRIQIQGQLEIKR